MRLAPVVALQAIVAVGSWGTIASAQNAQQALQRAAEELTATGTPASDSPRTPAPPSLAQRIAAGDLLLRTRDYARAISELSRVVELQQQGGSGDAAQADARFMLAEAYFADGQLLSAARHYRQLVERAGTVAYSVHVPRSLVRLVDIAEVRAEPAKIEWVLQQAARLPQDASATLRYAQAKAYLALGQNQSARAAAEQVPRTSPVYPQAQYLLGVIVLEDALGRLEQDGAESGGAKVLEPFSAALSQFQSVTELNVETPEQRHVVDLCWMALGRILFELQSYRAAADAYRRVSRDSPEKETAWHELAWAYLRMGDQPRALHLLGILELAAADSLTQADDTLLRGDLLLRAREYAEALSLYQDIRERYAPLLQRLGRFLDHHPRAEPYYQWLVTRELPHAAEEQPPAPVVQWARELAAEGPLGDLTGAVADSRGALDECQDLVLKLQVALGPSARAGAEPLLQARQSAVLGQLNHLALARYWAGRAIDAADPGPGKGEISTLRAQRRALMERISRVPTSAGDFASRARSGRAQWAELSQQLQRQGLEVDRLQALTNALSRTLAGALDSLPPALSLAPAEVTRAEGEVHEYRDLLQRYQRAIEIGSFQVGLQDKRFLADEQVRTQFARLLDGELRAMASAPGSQALAEVVRQGSAISSNAEVQERRLSADLADVLRQVDAGAQRLSGEVRREQQALAAYTRELQGLEQQAQQLLAERTRGVFEQVHDRVRNIVLRADVAVADQAWALREDAQDELESLYRRRALQSQQLEREQADVLDETRGTP